MKLPRIRIPKQYRKFRPQILEALQEMLKGDQKPSGRPEGSYKPLEGPWRHAGEVELRRFLEEHTNAEVAAALGVSSRTVDRYRRRLGSRRHPVKGPGVQSRRRAAIEQRLLVHLQEPRTLADIQHHMDWSRQQAHVWLRGFMRVGQVERLERGVYRALRKQSAPKRLTPRQVVKQLINKKEGDDADLA